MCGLVHMRVYKAVWGPSFAELTYPVGSMKCFIVIAFLFESIVFVVMI